MHELFTVRSARVLLLGFFLLAIPGGCGGGGGNTPSSPSAPTTPTTPDTATAATATGNQIALVTMRALRGAQSGQSQGFLAGPLRAVGSYTYACPAGGQVVVGPLPAAIGQPESTIGVTGVQQQWTSCAWEAGQRYTANGTTTLGGDFRPFSNQQNVTVASTGSYTVQPVGEMSVAGTVTGDASFTGTIGNETVNVGGPGITIELAQLTGTWSGAATFNAPTYGCSGRAFMTLALTHAGTQLSGTVTLLLEASAGSNPVCSLSFPNGPIGATWAFPVSGTASNGALSLSGDGLQIGGEYGSSGGTEWMGGTFSGSVQGYAGSGTWQARK